MTEWMEDERGRPQLTDPVTGTRYRLESSPHRHDDSVQLAVYLAGSGRSYDRTVFANAELAKAHTERRMQHDREEQTLGRRKTPSSTKTPWGRSRSSTHYADGITLYSTSENDGFHLSPERNAAVPASLRLLDGWYQEDLDGPRVILAFPEAFTSVELEDAHRTAPELFPEEYEAFVQESAPAIRP